jgi:hypothetical protein
MEPFTNLIELLQKLDKNQHLFILTTLRWKLVSWTMVKTYGITVTSPYILFQIIKLILLEF